AHNTHQHFRDRCITDCTPTFDPGTGRRPTTTPSPCTPFLLLVFFVPAASVTGTKNTRRRKGVGEGGGCSRAACPVAGSGGVGAVFSFFLAGPSAWGCVCRCFKGRGNRAGLGWVCFLWLGGLGGGCFGC